MSLATSTRERLTLALYAVIAGVIVASVGLGVWAIRIQARLSEEMKRAASTHAEVLARDFTERFWIAYDESNRRIFPSLQADLSNPFAVVDSLLHRATAYRVCRCGPAMHADGAFAWYSERRDEIFTRGMSSAQAANLRDKVALTVDTLRGQLSQTLVLKADLVGNELLAVTHLQRDARGGPTFAYGYLGNLESLRREFVEPIARRVTALRLGPHADGIVSWRILRPTGEPIFSFGAIDPDQPWTRHRLWARTFVQDNADVREYLLGPMVAWSEGSLPAPGADPRRNPYLVAVQVSPVALASALYGPATLRQLAVVALLASTLLLCVVSLLFTRKFVRHLREREAFASAVAHDLRTPLTQVLLYAETLQLERPAHRARRDAARIIVRETRRLIHLVENALHFTRGRPAAPRLHIVETSPAAVVHDALAAFQLMLERGEVHVKRAMDESLRVRVDSEALTQVLGNVLDNALRFGPPRQTLRVSVTQVERSVHLAVEDEGPGVPASQREVVFEPFARGGRVAGTGIGLAVARQLVELMEGTISITAGSRGGARVTIAFPAIQATDVPEHAVAGARRVRVLP